MADALDAPCDAAYIRWMRSMHSLAFFFADHPLVAQPSPPLSHPFLQYEAQLCFVCPDSYPCAGNQRQPLDRLPSEHHTVEMLGQPEGLTRARIQAFQDPIPSQPPPTTGPLKAVPWSVRASAVVLAEPSWAEIWEMPLSPYAPEATAHTACCSSSSSKGTYLGSEAFVGAEPHATITLLQRLLLTKKQSFPSYWVLNVFSCCPSRASSP